MVSVEKVKTGAKLDRKCEVCGGQVFIRVWGKWVCKNCYIKNRKGNVKGNSGMTADNNMLDLYKGQMIISDNEIELVRVPKSNKAFSTLYLTHYPGSKGIVGRSINYLVYYNGRFAGIIGGNSPPYKVKPIDTYYNINDSNRVEMTKKILNNDVFRLILHEKNLASRVLSVFRKQCYDDYLDKYDDELIGYITFVKPPLTGSCYKADNWVFLGLTKGYGTIRRDKMWIEKKWIKTEPKLIFAHKV